MKALTVFRDLWADESGGSEGAASAGRLGFGIAGSIIGGIYGGSFGAQAGFLIGSLLGNILFPQTLPDIAGSRLDPNKLMVSAYGVPIPIGFGQFVVGGIVSYYPGFVEHEIEDETGGKGGGPTQSARSYTHTGSFRVNFCEGPAEAILKIWANRILIYDATNTTDPIVDAARINRAPGANAIRLYLGTETQLPDPTEQADKGVNDTPAYRGIVGAFFQNYPLDDSGGLPPQITALISIKATDAFPVVSLSPVPSNQPVWEWQPGKDTFIMSGDTPENFTQINARNQTVKETATGFIDQPTAPCVDGEGNLYRTHDLFAGDTHHVEKFDGTTMQLLEVGPTFVDPFTEANMGSSSGLSWQTGRVFGGIIQPDGTVGGELLFLQRQSRTVSVVVSLASLQVINLFDVGPVIQYLTVDSERHLWTAHNSAGDIILNRVSPGNGDIVETHTVAGETVDFITYDEGTNSLILGDSTSTLLRWGIDSNLIDARMDGITPVSSGGKNFSEFWNGPSSSGKMYLADASTAMVFHEFDIVNMVQGRSWNAATDFGLSFGGGQDVGGMYDESRHAFMKRQGFTGGIHWLFLDRVTGDAITVKEIVDFICLRIGLAASQFVTSNLTQQLIGYLIAQRVPANTALDPLRRFFFFNPISEDFKIKFPLLGTSSVATIPEDDLAAGDDGQVRVEVDKLVEELISEIELPEVIEMESAGENRQFQPQVQVAKWPRTTTNSRRRRFLSFPGTFISDTDAAKRLQSLLFQIWNKRRPVTIRTSQKWLRLSPSDVITVQAEGLSHQVVIGQIDQGANNVLEIRGSADDPRDLISVATGFSGTVPDQEISSTGASEFFILDISLLRDQDDGFGVYLAGGPFGNSSGWKGEEILRSADSTSYSPFAFISGSRAVEHGFTTTIPGDADDGVWDRDTLLDITMSRGTLPSTTEALALNGAGLLLVGNELLCYVTSVDNGNGSFTVSTLLRGRGGTESEIANHVAAERVIVIDANTLVRKPMDLSDQGNPFFYKGVTRGGSLSEALRKLKTVLGKSQWTWAPVHVTGSITSDDWTINWTWRNRINGHWRNLQGIAAPGAFDYEVDVLAAPGGAVLATYTSTASANGSVVTGASHQFFYDDADQAIDFGDVQTTFTIKIYPISLGGVGRGFPTEVTLIGG